MTRLSQCEAPGRGQLKYLPDVLLYLLTEALAAEALLDQVDTQ